MKEEALIIFVRKPEAGKVKTRLAAAIGAEAALTIYQKLLEHTHSTSLALDCDKYVFYADAVEEKDRWQNDFHKQQQAQTDLGGRMKAAFTQIFQKGYSRVCIIGSDCFELTSAIITDAFLLLHRHEVVIGPARDGGYYLLGMRSKTKDLFDGVEWSTGKVLAQTIEKLLQNDYSYALLPLLTDVDTINDVPEEVLSILKQGGCRATT